MNFYDFQPTKMKTLSVNIFGSNPFFVKWMMNPLFQNSAARKRRNYEQQLELQELQEKRLLMSKQMNNNNYIRHDNM